MKTRDMFVGIFCVGMGVYVYVCICVWVYMCMGVYVYGRAHHTYTPISTQENTRYVCV